MKDYSNYHGSSKARMIDGGKKLFQMHLNGFDAVDVFVNDSPRRLIITEKYSTKEILRKVIDEHGKLKSGDVVYYSDCYWVVRKIDNENQVYDTATMEYSPSSLKWQNRVGNILEYPFIFNSENLSNFGIDEGKVISLLNDRRNIAIRSTKESKEIKVGQRFIFDGSAWKVISINRLNPLIELILESTIIDTAKDNMELRIADYVKANYSIVLSHSSVTMKVSDTMTLAVQVLNNGYEVPSPSVTYVSSNNEVCSINNNGLMVALTEGAAVITVTYKDVSASVNVLISDAQEINHRVTINGDITIFKSRSKSYTCTFYENDVPVLLDGTFSLTDVNGNSTQLATITSQSNNFCTVRGDGLGKVVLHVSNPSGTIRSELTIQVKSPI